MIRTLETVVLAMFCCVVTVAQTRSDGVETVRGVWRVTEITTTRQKGATNRTPQPSVYIFTARHYGVFEGPARGRFVDCPVNHFRS
jgi:hypothetical protein